MFQISVSNRIVILFQILFHLIYFLSGIDSYLPSSSFFEDKQLFLMKKQQQSLLTSSFMPNTRSSSSFSSIWLLKNNWIKKNRLYSKKDEQRESKKILQKQGDQRIVETKTGKEERKGILHSKFQVLNSEDFPKSEYGKGTVPLLPPHYWTWDDSDFSGGKYQICYSSKGSQEDEENKTYETKGANKKPALLLIHGFGGNRNHWRRNIHPLSEKYNVYSIDLIGYGDSDKPDPKQFGDPNAFYCFETWARQTFAFIKEVMREEKVYLATNSVGGITALQLAVDNPEVVKGLVVTNPSLRMLHIEKQSAFVRPFVKLFQDALRETALGQFFFQQVAQPKAVKNILSEAYYNSEMVTSDLVEAILKPGLTPGAVSVFLDFLSYSSGPLPEDLLRQLSGSNIPIQLIWAANDPWEDINLGKEWIDIEAVESFIELQNAGHCPQDEIPDAINSLITTFISQKESI